MPRHVRTRTPVSQKRLTQWVALTAGFLDFTASQQRVVVGLSQAALAPFVPCTVIRTVGLLVVAADLNFITNQIFTGAVGGCVVREAARGGSAVPFPFTDAGDDVWFWHQFFAMQIDDRTDSDIKVSERYNISSKGQRKLVDGDALLFNAEGGGEADGFDLGLFVRVLLKLH